MNSNKKKIPEPIAINNYSRKFINGRIWDKDDF